MKYGLMILAVCFFPGALLAQDGPDPLGFNAKWNNALELQSNDGSTSIKVGGRIMLDNAQSSDAILMLSSGSGQSPWIHRNLVVDVPEAVQR